MNEEILNKVDETIKHLCSCIEKTDDYDEKTRLTGVLANLLSARANYA